MRRSPLPMHALSVVSRHPHDSRATLGYGAIHRQTPVGSLSLTQLDPGDNSIAFLLLNLVNVFAIIMKT